jgi:two-component system, chemotaxis family, protein-glutamate methylesterase/glutaminase
MKVIRVLVVDDSRFLRRNLPLILESVNDIKVIGTAANGVEAVEMARRLRPDVITLDVIMPVMDGIAALRQIMSETPVSVVMLSSSTYEGARQTIEALSLGAVDFIAKPSGSVSLDIATIRHEIIEKVRTAAIAHRTAQRGPGMAVAKPSAGGVVTTQETAAALKMNVKKELLAIAASTGGPAALQVVLRNLPSDLSVGIVIVQHMSEGFTEAFAERLNEVSPLEIKVSNGYELIRPGVGLIAPFGMHLEVKRIDGRLYAVVNRGTDFSLHKPSADVMFSSAAKVCGSTTCAVIMTGMGDDGARGITEISNQGGITIAQDEATSVIFGMPGVAIKNGGIDIVAPLECIAGVIVSAL